VWYGLGGGHFTPTTPNIGGGTHWDWRHAWRTVAGLPRQDLSLAASAAAHSLLGIPLSLPRCRYRRKDTWAALPGLLRWRSFSAFLARHFACCTFSSPSPAALSPLSLPMAHIWHAALFCTQLHYTSPAAHKTKTTTYYQHLYRPHAANQRSSTLNCTPTRSCTGKMTSRALAYLII